MTRTRQHEEVSLIVLSVVLALQGVQAQTSRTIEGIPAVYEVNGRQYLVYPAAARATTHTHAIPGHPASTAPIPGAYVAFALPNSPGK